MSLAAASIPNRTSCFTTQNDVVSARDKFLAKVDEFRAFCNTQLQASRKGFSGQLIYALRDREGTIGKILILLRNCLCWLFSSLELKRQEQQILVGWDQRDFGDTRDYLFARSITLKKFSWAEQFEDNLKQVRDSRHDFVAAEKFAMKLQLNHLSFP